MELKYPNHALFMVVDGNAVASMSSNGYVVLETLAQDDLVRVIDEDPKDTNRSNNPRHELVDIERHQTDNMYRFGAQRHVVIRRSRFLMAMPKDDALTKLAQEVKGLLDQRDQMHNTAVTQDKKLAETKKTLAELDDRIKSNVAWFEQQQRTHEQERNDLRARTDEVKELRRKLDAVRAHIGQREYDRIFPPGAAKT